MRYTLAILAIFTALAIPTAATAQVVTRDGSDYNGYANPDGCNIFVHDELPDELHVNCKKVDGVARIRYRFTPKAGYNGTFDAADVSVEWDKHSQGTANVRWMVPVPRTVRVVVTGYVHIVSVTWDQP